MNEEEIRRYFSDLVTSYRLIYNAIWTAETAARRLDGRSDAPEFGEAISSLYGLRTRLEIKVMEMRKDAAAMGIVLEIPL